MGSVRSCHQKKHGNSVRGFLAQHAYNFPSQASIVNPLLHGTFTPLSRSLVLFVSRLLALVITVRWIVLDLTKSDLRIFRTGLCLYLLTKVWKLVLEESYGHTIIPPQFQCLKFIGSWMFLLLWPWSRCKPFLSVRSGTCFKALLKC